jgi:hypothetical protein
MMRICHQQQGFSHRSVRWYMCKIVGELHNISGDEEDLALLAVLVRDELEVVDGVAALGGWHGLREVVVGLARLPHPVHHHLLRLPVDLERDEPEAPLRLEVLELELALVAHSHPRRRVRLAYSCISSSKTRTAISKQTAKHCTARTAGVDRSTHGNQAKDIDAHTPACTSSPWLMGFFSSHSRPGSTLAMARAAATASRPETEDGTVRN